MSKDYYVDTLVYTEASDNIGLSSNDKKESVTNGNSLSDNLLTIMRSRTTLNNVSLRLFAQCLIKGEKYEDNIYITAKSYRDLLASVPPDVLALIDKTSIDRSVANLMNYSKADKQNYVFGLFNYYHPFFSYDALKRIESNKTNYGDMIQISYTSSDPSIAYQTIVILNEEFVKKYKELRYSETNDLVAYFRTELEIAKLRLLNLEDSLIIFKQKNRIINYGEQTKYLASRDNLFKEQHEVILSALQKSEAAIIQIEQRLDTRSKLMLENTMLLDKLGQYSTVSSQIARAETVMSDSLKRKDKMLDKQKSDLKRIEKDLFATTKSIGEYTNSKDGIATESLIDQWLTEKLIVEKSKAHLKIMDEFRKNIDDEYEFFSPLGALLGRRDREIDFATSNYMNILNSLNVALFREKGLQLTSSSIQVMNPPVYPLNNMPTKRKKIFLLAVMASFVILLCYFIVIEFLDSTIRDDERAELHIKKKPLFVVPYLKNALKILDNNVIFKAASNYLFGALYPYFQDKNSNYINLLSNYPGEGKSFIGKIIQDELLCRGFSVTYLKSGIDFDMNQKRFIEADKVTDLLTVAEQQQSDFYIIEHQANAETVLPLGLLKNSSINLLICDATRGWKEPDHIYVERIEKQSGKNLFIALNNTSTNVLERFTGLIPPFTRKRIIMSRIENFDFTSKIKTSKRV